MDEIKRFRQLHSKTPGHPEYGHTPGVETTTGPLGQGLANAVGMAIAEKNLAAEFNREGFDIINHYTYVTVGDGCLMEGISHEACSLAGTLKLGKLICLFDSNQVSIDGDVRGWFTEDTAKRFKSYGWHVIRNVDGHDPEQVKRALRKARKVTDKPSLVVCHTIIGWGAPNKQGKASCHGSPLGKEEVALARKQIGWSYDPFVIPDDYYSAWDARHRGKRIEIQWKKKFANYRQRYPELAAEFERRINRNLPANWEDTTSAFIRKCSEKAETIGRAGTNSQELG